MMNIPIPDSTQWLGFSACLSIFLFCSGCSSQQLYTIGQSWQRNNCNRLVDEHERTRCAANADVPYAIFKRETDESKK